MVEYKNHPFLEVHKVAEEWMKKGARVHQKFTCEHCGSRQTMAEANVWYTTGRCEECGKITNIVKTGCNFLLHIGKELPKDGILG